MKKVNIVIKRLKKQDIPLLGEILIDDGMKYRPNMIETFLDIPGNVGFIARIEEQIVGLVYGYTLLDIDGRTMFYIYSVGIYNQYKKKDLGIELINRVIRYCEKKGISECFVLTNKNNTRARKIFRKVGLKSKSDEDMLYSMRFDK